MLFTRKHVLVEDLASIFRNDHTKSDQAMFCFFYISVSIFLNSRKIERLKKKHFSDVKLKILWFCFEVSELGGHFMGVIKCDVSTSFR